jgi:hypothetical protein
MRRKDMNKVLFLLAVLMMCNTSYAADPISERPAYSAGDYWIFTEDGKDVRVEFVREEKEHYVFSRDGVQVVKNLTLTNVDQLDRGYPGPIVKFPLKKGKWWNYEYTAQLMASSNLPDQGRVARYEVADYEQIAVPAGTFWAFKITVTKETRRRGKPMGSATYWYSPEVKQIIRSSEAGNPLLELKEYKIKDKGSEALRVPS